MKMKQPTAVQNDAPLDEPGPSLSAAEGSATFSKGISPGSTSPEPEGPFTLAQVIQEELDRLRPDEPPTAPPVAGDITDLFRRMSNANLKALCLSGGGIRSATFALGILQSLAAHGLLSKFDYLSTVSGGGYIG